MADPLLTATPDIVVVSGSGANTTKIDYVTGSFVDPLPRLWERLTPGTSWKPVDLASRVTRSDAHGFFRSPTLAPGVLYQVRLYHDDTNPNPPTTDPPPDFEIGVPSVRGPTTLITDRGQQVGGTHYSQRVATGSTATNFFLQVGVSPPITDPNGLKHLTSPLLTGFSLLNTIHQLDLPERVAQFPEVEPLLPGNDFFAVGLVFDASGYENFVVPFTTHQRQVVIKYQELHIISNGKRFPDVGHTHAQFWIWVREGDKTVNIDNFTIQDDDHIDLDPLGIPATALGPEKVTAANRDLGILIRGLADHSAHTNEPCANYFPAEFFPDDVTPPVKTPSVGDSGFFLASGCAYCRAHRPRRGHAPAVGSGSSSPNS